MLNWMTKKRRIIGLEMKDSVIKWVELERADGVAQIVKYHSQPIPDDLIAAGHIQDEERFFEWMSIVKEKKGLKNQEIHMAINAQQLLLRPMRIANAPKKELRRAIELEIENQIQPPFDDYVFDFSIFTPKEKREAAEELDIMLVIAPKSYILSYTTPLRKLGLSLKSIDLAPLSVIRALEENEAWTLESTYMVVNVGRKSVEVSIVHEGAPRLIRTFSIDIQTYLENESKASLDAHRLLFTRDQPGNLDSFADDIGRELERILHFYLYTLNHREQEIALVTLVGEISNLQKLADYLAIRLNLRVLVEGIGDRWIAPALRESFGSITPAFVVPFGLALKGANHRGN